MHKAVEMKAEETLREKEELYRTIFENTGTATVIFEEDATITLANAKFTELTGYTRDGIENKKKWTEFVVGEDLEMMQTMHHLRRIDPAATPKSYEFRAVDKYGGIKNILLSIDTIPGTKQRIASLLDITENKRAEEVLRLDKEKYRSIFENSIEGIFQTTPEGQFITANKAFSDMLGYDSPEEFRTTVSDIPHHLYVNPEDRAKLLKMIDECCPIKGFETTFYRKDGSTLYVSLSAQAVRDMEGNILYYQGICQDLTKDKEAEDKLRRSEEKYRTILEDIQEGYFEVDFAGNFTFVNDSIYRFLGYSKEELMGMNNRQYTDKENAKKLFQAFNKVYNTGEPTEGFDWQIIRKDGTKRYVEASASLQKDSSGKPIGFRGIVRDVTERKKAEEELKNSELKYRNIFENAIEGIYQSTTEGRFITANAAFAQMAGYGSPEELVESIKDMGTQLYVHPEDRKRFLVISDAEGFVDGFEVEFYKKDGSKFWVVVNARTVKDEQGKILYNEGFIEDITIRKHAEEQLHQTLDRLRKAVITTIQVLVSTVESRDPYTAGHQKRVADLARTIATEMGLPHDIIEGIRMAGSIHDIGKLSIPAEILVKPTKLTNIEFSLIKEHAKNGYEMLKDVDSPWPLAEIVYQHHERMDGSGYPRNLKGDEFLLEARILAVADVVESMASHRPYRAALGIEAALEEIDKNKGILYDAAVANACIRLFREKGYQLTQG
ncbi:MAG TPA: PAS domain S-box protein [Smithella sp.]|nr:PAS domain S-box protein [Smithella sp.]